MSAEEVRERVLSVVAEKTGYPRDMLDLELDLEADLGIDTVKQAELFATVREVYGIERDDQLKLPRFSHAGACDRFCDGSRPGAQVVVPGAVADGAPAVADGSRAMADGAPCPGGVPVSEEEVRERVLSVVAEKTGYPRDMLDLELDLEADLGIDTVKQAELFATVREVYGIERDDQLKLRDFPTLEHVIGFVMDRAPGAQAGVPASQPAAVAATSAVPAEPRPEAFVGLDACETVPRRVPVPVLRPPLSLCRETPVALTSGSRVVVMPDRGGAGEALVRDPRGAGSGAARSR